MQTNPPSRETRQRVGAGQPRVRGATAAGAGFTLVELIAVLTLVGILAAVAGPRFLDGGTFDERGYYDELASALRYAQKLAVASGCPVRAAITAGGYVLGQQAPLAGHCDPADTSFANPVLMPDGQAMTGSAPAGIAVAPATAVVFHAAGGTNLAADQSVSVGARTLTIVAASGLVQAP